MRDGVAEFVLPILIGVLYMRPTLVAYAREASQRRLILLANAAFGWTVVGWIAVSIWAVSAAPQQVRLLRVRSDEF
jgi:Superinfection immunity protein